MSNNNNSTDICNYNVFSEQQGTSESKKTNDVTIELKEKLLSNNNVNNKSTNDTNDEEEERDVWSNKIEYMLSVIGYVVDLGSIYKT